MRQINSNVKVNVIDNRKNGGNYKWQIEKLDVILDFFNDDFFNVYPNVKVEVIVNSKEVLPKMIVDGMSILPDYIRYFKAFSKSKKEMVEEMNYMVEMMNNELNNNMEENNMVDMVNNVDMFNECVKNVLVEDFENAVSSAEDFADTYGDDCVENEYICGSLDYDYDIRKMWADWCWENDVLSRDDAYKYYDDNSDMFICEDDLDNIVEGLDGTDDVGNGECLVWVKNPYYVEQEQVENDSPCLDDVDMFNECVKNVLVEDFKNAVDSAEGFANEYGDNFVENEHICGGFDYDYDIREMWADWCWENDVLSRDDAYKYYDANRDMFINEDDLCECVYGFEDTYGVGIDDNCCGSCLIWVKNPYYVSEDVERVVKIIEGYVNNYEGMLMDYDGNSASICVPWDVFNEDDMKMLIEDADFEEYVVDVLMGRDIKDMLVYDDGVYVSVDAKMFDKVA